jgi:hypothetical protein
MYINGKKEGRVSWKYENGMTTVQYYSNNKPVGLEYEYNGGGKLIATYEKDNRRQLHGATTRYRDNGSISRITHYRDGKLLYEGEFDEGDNMPRSVGYVTECGSDVAYRNIDGDYVTEDGRCYKYIDGKVVPSLPPPFPPFKDFIMPPTLMFDYAPLDDI